MVVGCACRSEVSSQEGRRVNEAMVYEHRLAASNKRRRGD